MTPCERFTSSIDDAAGLAAAYADQVDSEARFPVEAVDALRRSGALSAAVPTDLGGIGISIGELCDACRVLSGSCASTGMIFAMHQVQVACLARHVHDKPLRDYLAGLARAPRLIASITSEVGVGGDLRQSIAALEPADGDNVRFEKAGTTVSYGMYADDFLITLRRSSDAAPGDQVLALVDAAAAVLRETNPWDALGMRGTCSPAITIRAELPRSRVLAEPFATVATETMVPYSHLLWSHCWLGIADAAAQRARAFVQASARRAAGRPSNSGVLPQLIAELSALRSLLREAVDEFEAVAGGEERERLTTFGYALRLNNVKLVASETAMRVCTGALQVSGSSGYRNDTPFSVGRQLRDVLSAPLMISNDRLREINATLLLVHDGVS